MELNVGLISSPEGCVMKAIEKLCYILATVASDLPVAEHTRVVSAGDE